MAWRNRDSKGAHIIVRVAQDLAVRARRVPWPLVWVALVSIALLIVHTWRFPSFFFDDSFISLRYADRLRSGHGFTWTDGERVEGCTNFLWVALVAAMGLFSNGLITPTRVLGAVCTGIAIVALVWAARGKGWREAAAPAFAGLGVASLGPIAAWTRGGLESPLVLAALGSAIAFSYASLEQVEPSRRLSVGLGLSLAALVLTRPDGALFTATFCVGLVVTRGLRRAAWKDAFVAGGISTSVFVAMSIFRRLYFGSWTPNTSFKLFVGKSHFDKGLAYVTRDGELWAPFLLLAGLGIAFAVTSAAVRKRMTLLILAASAWLAYVIIIGGDFMPERRHLVPALFLLVAMGAEAIRSLASLRGRSAIAAWYLAISACAWVALGQRNDWAVADANNTAWYWTGKPIGRFFRSAFGAHDPLVAVDAAGSLPYFSKLRSLDMLGLNDRFLASHPPHLAGEDMVAHELGDGAYALGRKPDLVVFHFPYGQERPEFLSGKQMVKLPPFRTHYQKLYYVTPKGAASGMAYVRHRDGPLAPHWDHDVLNFPLYLLATNKNVRASLDDRGRVVLITRNRAWSSYTLALKPGHCTATGDATENVVLSVRSVNQSHRLRAGQPVDIPATPQGKVVLTLHAVDALPGKAETITFACEGQ